MLSDAKGAHSHSAPQAQTKPRFLRFYIHSFKSKMYKTTKLCLRWNDFQDYIHSSFGELRHDTDFVDVTLACEDGSQVKAHKVILAASSLFFQNLLKMNKNPHPLIYIRGVRAEDLLAILDFVYNGEANIFQQNLDSFLAIAGDLQIRGLADSDPEIREDEKIPEAKMPEQKITLNRKFHLNERDPNLSDQPPNLRERNEKPSEPFRRATNSETSGLELHDLTIPEAEVQEEKIRPEGNQEQFQPNKPHLDLDEPSNFEEIDVKYNVPAGLGVPQLDAQIKSMMEWSGNMTQKGQIKTKAQICKVCGKEGHRTDIKRHIEAHHITGMVHTCGICGKGSRSRDGLRRHNIREHF